MINGAEHYTVAERLIDAAEGMPLAQGVAQIAVAQVHATLAQAAAVIETAASRGPGDVSRDWLDAVGIAVSTEPPL